MISVVFVKGDPLANHRFRNARISPMMRFFCKTDRPRAKRRVHYGPFGESIGKFWRVHFLSGRIVQKICGFLPPASLTQSADRFAVFRGVHPRLHGSVCSVPNKNDQVETHLFGLGNLLPVRGAVSWQSVCEFQRVRFLFRDV